ncbi:hypothetical protein KI387_006596, partial [Taxus chinensis]
TIGNLTDLGFLWFREFYLETSRVIQFPIECSLPWMLVDQIIESQDAGLLESLLMPFDIYNDSAQHALHVLKQRFLYDEIEAEIALGVKAEEAGIIFFFGTPMNSHVVDGPALDGGVHAHKIWNEGAVEGDEKDEELSFTFSNFSTNATFLLGLNINLTQSSLSFKYIATSSSNLYFYLSLSQSTSFLFIFTNSDSRETVDWAITIEPTQRDPDRKMLGMAVNSLTVELGQTSKLLDPAFLFASDNADKYSVTPRRYDALFKMRRVKLLGRSIDLRYLIGQRMNKIFRENIDFLFERFESHDICSVVELQQLFDVLRLTYQLLEEYLTMDPFSVMLNEMSENISLVSFSGRLASQ